VLRAARENVGMTVEDLADRTRIRPFVIESMESDDFSPCGGDFYARGHLRMLARVLGIASEPLIATYDERFANGPVSLRAVFDAELSAGTTGMVRGGVAGAHWGGLITAVVILVLIWGVAKYFAGA
jgi:cytoskeleton protein RodZ